MIMIETVMKLTICRTGHDCFMVKWFESSCINIDTTTTTTSDGNSNSINKYIDDYCNRLQKAVLNVMQKEIKYDLWRCRNHSKVILRAPKVWNNSLQNIKGNLSTAEYCQLSALGKYKLNA